jgi:membrane protein implicated in regulation of membrane protease activity
MKQQSARALIWTSGILLLLGFMIPSPTGSFALFALAVVAAAIPSLLAVRPVRYVAFVLLGVSVAVAASTYPAFRQDQDAYAKRVKERAAKQPVASPPEQGTAKK